MIDSVDIAKWVMRMREVTPAFDKNNIGGLREVFTHAVFLEGSDTERREIMFKSSESRYIDESSYPFDNYFGFELKSHLEGSTVLDLGCGTGGRAAAWFDRYNLKHVAGMEIDPIYVEAAQRFADGKGIDAKFKVGFGESIPFPDGSFDAVLSFDVIEHVVDVRKTLAECLRVLRPSGKLFVVFPTYFQPVEHHLGMVSKVPGLQLLFSGKTLVKAYCEIIEERGYSSNWYRRTSPELGPHEAGNTINGTSFRQFTKYAKHSGWETLFIARKPIGSLGRSLRNESWSRALSTIFTPLTYIPYLQEVFLHRVTMVLQKK